LIISILGVGFIMIPLRAFFGLPTRNWENHSKNDKSDMDHMKTERINEIAATPRQIGWKITTSLLSFKLLSVSLSLKESSEIRKKIEQT
jgi:hypothetical protein